ncbi:hypothetical protein TNCV_1432811 [Trichonephila clavipes]|nr:hypothetical protein TNCV_1432811 [Trichonephila clavipes]
MKERPVSEITPGGKENGRTRTKLEYVTRARNGRAQEGGLTAPKRVRGAPKTQWEGKCCNFFFFFLCSQDENERSLQGKLTDNTAGVNEAGASFNTDPSSDERQMHLNVVKCSN